jgi:hypothetical protein
MACLDKNDIKSRQVGSSKGKKQGKQLFNSLSAMDGRDRPLLN